jgi:ubiquinone/menaquinone biosynthesis C-methylase UbiE
MTLQKDIFKEGEGDAWYRRNRPVLEARDWSKDSVVRRLLSLPADTSNARILEIGCGDGSRLAEIKKHIRAHVSGVDPSQLAVKKALERGVDALAGTAETLPFGDASFDIVLFGFCLYLCDDADLFRIAAEADRVLAPSSWLLINDFDSAAPHYNRYHHREGVLSRKMDYKQMFLWHPSYTLVSYDKYAHQDALWLDDPHEWVSIACLRKFAGRASTA